MPKWEKDNNKLYEETYSLVLSYFLEEKQIIEAKVQNDNKKLKLLNKIIQKDENDAVERKKRARVNR